MGKYRAPSENSKYYIPKEDYLTARHYALRYPRLKAEVEVIANTAKAIDYKLDRVQTSGDSDSTFEAACKLYDSNSQHVVQIIEDTIKAVADDMEEWLKLGVCYGMTFPQLKAKGIPCERDSYYKMRRNFYFELVTKI